MKGITMQEGWTLPIGARPDASGTHFRVWATNATRVDVVLYGTDGATGTLPLQPEGNGYFSTDASGVRPGTRYAYRIDGGDPRPDPASRFQPEGVHGPSQVVDAAFEWTDAEWRGVPMRDLIIYEVNVGTATEAGTFSALIERLDDLRELGVTAIELMPLADFPGDRNWGYDGVNLFAPSRAYGEPVDLRRLVDAAHARGLAVLLDVVYNHLGPDGNYLRQFSNEYFTDRHKTPWGDALNFDGPGSRAVRDFFVGNALYWAHEFHFDGLRLDATHAILDDGPTHILAELTGTVRASLPPERQFLIIAENEGNDPKLVRQPPNGYGLDGVWADDFHHQIRVALVGEREGYFADFMGTAEDIAATLRQGWFYVGQPSALLGHARGLPADDVPASAFVYCIQNHDQVGNRAVGDRLNHAIEPAAYRAASALLLLSPYTPLLWMGQEWSASTPFLFFTDHNEHLGRLVSEGRRAEFAYFTAFSGEEVPDPQTRDTFLRSKLLWDERAKPAHTGTLQLYRDALALRKQHPALRTVDRDSFAAFAVGENALVLRRNGPAAEDALLLIVNLRGATKIELAEDALTAPAGLRWSPLLSTESEVYGGAGTATWTDGVLMFDGPAAVLLAAKGIV